MFKIKIIIMEKNKRRILLIFSSMLTLAIGGILIALFVLVSFEGIINNFTYFGVLSNFTEIIGVIGLSCLIFGLFCLKLGTSQFKMSKLNASSYKKNKYKLICSIIVYSALVVVSAFCIFETYTDISAVGQAFLNANIGYFAIAMLSASVVALILVIIDLFVFRHDLKNGLISLTPENAMPLLLNAPQYKLIYKDDEKFIDYSKLEGKLKQLDDLKQKGIITQEEYADMKHKIIETFF